MKDIAGNILKLDDKVAVFTGGKYPNFSLGVVAGFTSKRVKINNGKTILIRQPEELAVLPYRRRE